MDFEEERRKVYFQANVLCTDRLQLTVQTQQRQRFAQASGTLTRYKLKRTPGVIKLLGMAESHQNSSL